MAKECAASGPRRRSRSLERTLFSSALALLAAGAPPLAPEARAAERGVELRFLPPADPVEGYRAYVTDETSAIEHVLDLGFVSPGSDGVARSPIVLDTAVSYSVGMTAYNGFGESGLSNQIAIPATTCDASPCDDGNACTVDACDAAGCLNTPAADGAPCDDGMAETVDDQCVAGACQGFRLACYADADCDDGDVCNGSELCDAGTACVSGQPLDCGGPTQCADAVCDPQLGCLRLPVADGSPCEDGRDETVGDACFGGVCESGEVSTGFAVAAVVPEVVPPGKVAVEIHGEGFADGAWVYLENGIGPAPRVRDVEVLDARRMVVRLDVRRQGPKRERTWDVVVSLPDGRSARLSAGLVVDPR